jgi:hypothetical protein
MKLVRELDPDVPCDELMERELEAVSSFADGWLASRLLFGGLPFLALDEIAFAREHDVLGGMLAARADRQLGACADEWASEHRREVEDYLEWRETRFLELVEAPPAEADTTTGAVNGEGP